MKMDSFSGERYKNLKWESKQKRRIKRESEVFLKWFIGCWFIKITIYIENFDKKKLNWYISFQSFWSWRFCLYNINPYIDIDIPPTADVDDVVKKFKRKLFFLIFHSIIKFSSNWNMNFWRNIPQGTNTLHSIFSFFNDLKFFFVIFFRKPLPRHSN